jgi:hypothetical protein
MKTKYLSLVLVSTVAIALASTTASIIPTGVGTYSAWTPSTGATHYTLVDETTCNGTTDYVSTTVTGSRDSYAVSLGSIPDGSTVTAIAVTPCASKSKSSGSSVMNVFYRMNGSNSADAGAYSLTGTTPTALAATNYTGLSITKNASTTLEIGAILTSGTGGARLSQIATVITYSVPVTLPSTPTNFVGTPMSTSTFNYARLTWTDTSSNEDGFKVEKGTDGINFSQIATTTANITSYNDFAVATSTTYYYRLRAYNTAGNSAYATTTSVTIP